MKIGDPLEHAGCWISDKEHIVLSLAQDVEEARAVELQRRSLIRLARKQKAAGAGTGTGASSSSSRHAYISGKMDVSAETSFLLNGNQRHTQPMMHISDDFLTVHCGPPKPSGNSSSNGSAIYDGSGRRPMVLGSRGFTRGVHYWEVSVDSAEGWGCCVIGVCPADAVSWQGYGFLNYRATQSYGHESIYGKYYKSGDTIGVLLDLDRGRVSYLKDGEDFMSSRNTCVDLGTAFHHLRRRAGVGSGSGGGGGGSLGSSGSASNTQVCSCDVFVRCVLCSCDA
jgi:hypothetical protein